jgi:hypothetical protein
MEMVSVVEFIKPGANYYTGDKAGFAPEMARDFVQRGFARMVTENVPRIDPGVIVTDAQRKIADIRAAVTNAQRQAKAIANEPGAAAAAAETLSQASAALHAADALEQQLIAAGAIPAPQDGRRAPASARGA